MKLYKISLTLYLLVISLALLGQENPLWLDDNKRERMYPAEFYFTGYVYGNVPSDKTLQDIIQSLKTDAQADLSRKIKLQVTSKLQTNATAISANGQYDETESFFSQSTTESNIELIGTVSESYYDPKTNRAYAFAAVKRSDLTNFYQKQIELILKNVATELEIVAQMATEGKKIMAFKRCSQTKELLNKVAYYQSILVAINAEDDDKVLQNARCNKLIKVIEQNLISLNQSTKVFISCKYEPNIDDNDAFTSDPNIICGVIAQALGENKCNVTDNREDADFELNIIASSSERSNGSGQYGVISYYANVKGNLYDRRAEKSTIDFTIYNDATAYAVGKSAKDAATKAFKSAALKNKILETILPKLE